MTTPFLFQRLDRLVGVGHRLSNGLSHAVPDRGRFLRQVGIDALLELGEAKEESAATQDGAALTFIVA
jgi:hypothetical protein